MAAFRMALDPTMQQVVEVALGILPTVVMSPDQVLDLITDYVHAKRNVALDRVAFEERRQGPAESFEGLWYWLSPTGRSLCRDTVGNARHCWCPRY
jgi:hypothetical protein